MAANRYGMTGPYGDQEYKGRLKDSSHRIAGISFSDYRKCFHYGFNDDQGNGWDELRDTESDGDLPWPESQGAVCSVLDTTGQMLLVVWDEGSGLPYIINTREGPTGGDVNVAWKDKIDPNVSGSGTDIVSRVKCPDDYGEQQSDTIESQEFDIHMRPMKASNRGATGYETSGLPTSFELDASLYTDGKPTTYVTLNDISTSAENVFDRKDKGNTLTLELVANKSEYRLTSIEAHYKISDRARRPAIGRQVEHDYEAEFASPLIWLSRGAVLGLDRATGYNYEDDTTFYKTSDSITVDGATYASLLSTGPDGQTDSSFKILADLELATHSLSSGTLMVWSTVSSLDVIVNSLAVAMTQYGAAYGSWRLFYKTNWTNALPITLDAFRFATPNRSYTNYFDLRLYNSTLSLSAIEHYYNDVTDNNGKIYLPYF